MEPTARAARARSNRRRGVTSAHAALVEASERTHGAERTRAPTGTRATRVTTMTTAAGEGRDSRARRPPPRRRAAPPSRARSRRSRSRRPRGCTRSRRARAARSEQQRKLWRRAPGRMSRCVGGFWCWVVVIYAAVHCRRCVLLRFLFVCD